MTDAPPRRHRRIRAVSRRRDERGIVLVWMALTLVVLLMFAGFMVDLGAWYQQSQDIQRAADAAALAGSTYLPGSPGPAGGNIPGNCGTSVSAIENSTPTNAYCAVLKDVYKNGYTNATITANVDGANNRQLDVSIQQGGISQYFTSFFMGPLTFTRSSHAQFSQPINLGSPQNYFGMGTLEGYTGFGGSGTPNFWAEVGGYCEAKEGGDEFASGYDGNVNNIQNGTYTSTNNCDPTQDNRISNPNASCSANTTPPENCEFDPLGYEYTIEVPATAPANANLWAFNAKFDPCLSPPEYDNTGKLLAAPLNPGLPPLMDIDSNLGKFYPCNPGGAPSNATRITTYYTLSGPGGVVGTVSKSYKYTAQGGFPGWTKLFSGLTPGSTYYLDVSTLGVSTNGGVLASNPSKQDGNQSFGLHNYGLMVTTSGATPSAGLNDGASFVCSGPNCPSIYADTSTAMAVSIVSPVCTSGGCGNGSSATAYLANVPPAAIGKTVTLKIWDPGDYADYIQVLQPDGTPLPSFAYKVYGADPNSAAAYGGTIPNANNTTDQGNANVTSCTDPLTGTTMIDPTTGSAVTTPCIPVDGCVATPLPYAQAPPVYPCNTGNIGTSSWGAPNNRFGMAPYNDAMVQITFTANQSGWYGLKEVTNASQVNDVVSINLFVNGLPPHLTP